MPKFIQIEGSVNQLTDVSLKDNFYVNPDHVRNFVHYRELFREKTYWVIRISYVGTQEISWFYYLDLDKAIAVIKQLEGAN